MNSNIILKKDVHSHSRPMNHTVTLNGDGEWNCTCEHHKYRGAICKHILEVQDELVNENIVIVADTTEGVELIDIADVEDAPIVEVKGVADTKGNVVGGIIGVGIEVGRVVAVEDCDDEVVDEPVLVGVPTAKIPVQTAKVEVNDAKSLSQLKKALKLKEELLNLKERGVDVSECLEVVNDLILEI